jgi:predicted dehydrogenase
MIFTPHNAHIENVRDLSMCGKYVLLQKPIAGTLEDAAEICRLCEEKRMKLMVGENYRFSPALDKAKRLLAMGKIGKPVSVSVTAMSKSIPTGWRTRKEANGGGVLVDFGIHYLSALRHLCGEPQEISSVSCEHRIPGAEGESSIGFSAIMECGVVATADIAWGIGENADQKDIITITGEKGSITVDLSKAYITLDRKGRKRRLRLGSSDKYGHRTLLASFLTAAMEGLPINLDHKTGAGDLAFVKKVYASVATDPKRRDSGR